MAHFAGTVSPREGFASEDDEALWAWSERADSGMWAELAGFLDVIAEGGWSVERELRDGVSGVGWLPDVRLNSAEEAPRQHERDNPRLGIYTEDIQRRRAALRGLATDERSAVMAAKIV